MKKIYVILIALFILVGCGGLGSKTGKFNPKKLIKGEEAIAALNTAKDNVGASIEFNGKLFLRVDKDEKFVYYMVYRNYDKYTGDLLIKVSLDIASTLEEDDFIVGRGIILPESENTRANIYDAPVILVDSFESGTFSETIGVAKKEFDLNVEDSQYGHKVKISKIEFSDYDTRLHVEVINDTNEVISTYSSDFTLVINGRNYSETYMYNSDYKEIDSKLNAKTHTDGIIVFEHIPYEEITEIKIVIDEPYSSNWDLDFHDYIFDIKLK